MAKKYLKRFVLIVALLAISFSSRATHHSWQIVEVFSNADGTLQFIEMTSAADSHNLVTCCSMYANNKATGADKEWKFTADLASSNTNGKSMLIATAGFEAAFGIKPDYIIPDGYLAPAGGDVFYNNTLTWSALPTDGVMSYGASGINKAGTPKNFSGTEVTLTAKPTGTSATQFLMTTSNSANITTLHIVNTSDESQSFTGTLYAGSGEQLGYADTKLHTSPLKAKARIKLGAQDLETLFGVTPWAGPAMLEVKGEQSFELMGKLISPSGLVSNTNCVREDRVLNLEGPGSADKTFVRFINTTSTPMTNITGTLYDKNGAVIGKANTVLLASLAPKAAVWINRDEFVELIGASWQTEAMLEVTKVEGLKLLNLNFVNNETFFNFSCFESEESASVYLMTNSASANISSLHLVNTSTAAGSFKGTLYAGTGSRLGQEGLPLHEGTVPIRGRVVLTAPDLENIFGVTAWAGPAYMVVTGPASFELMIKLKSPSGLISNTNCVRSNAVHNIEGTNNSDPTFIRFINTGDTTISNIRGTLWDKNGDQIGTANTQLLASLAPRQAVWIKGSEMSTLFNNENWSEEAMLTVTASDSLRLLNLNFANNETFFNFSCYERSQ